MAGPYDELEADDDDGRELGQVGPALSTAEANAKATEQADIASLMERPEFHRFLLKIRNMAGIEQRSSWTNETPLAFEAGRRDLGLEVLESVRLVVPGVDLKLAVENATLQEGQNARSRRRQR